jgi:P22 coat protein - gene protein 5
MEGSRRAFLGGLAASLLAGPAIVRAGSLMPVTSKLLVPDILVNASWQTGHSIVISPLPFGLKLGDIITFPEVYALNRLSQVPTERLRQFVVTALATEGHTSLHLYPAIIPARKGERYATVDKPPMNNAKVQVLAWS